MKKPRPPTRRSRHSHRPQPPTTQPTPRPPPQQNYSQPPYNTLFQMILPDMMGHSVTDRTDQLLDYQHALGSLYCHLYASDPSIEILGRKPNKDTPLGPQATLQDFPKSKWQVTNYLQNLKFPRTDEAKARRPTCFLNLRHSVRLSPLMKLLNAKDKYEHRRYRCMVRSVRSSRHRLSIAPTGTLQETSQAPVPLPYIPSRSTNNLASVWNNSSAHEAYTPLWKTSSTPTPITCPRLLLLTPIKGKSLVLCPTRLHSAYTSQAPTGPPMATSWAAMTLDYILGSASVLQALGNGRGFHGATFLAFSFHYSLCISQQATNLLWQLQIQGPLQL